MMVQNRNWQKRVELAEQRRAASNQRKQQRGNKSMYKAQVQDLIACLDKYEDAILRSGELDTMHIWTDSLPVNCEYETYLPQHAEEGMVTTGGVRKFRDRSSSMGEAPLHSKSVRGRSLSFSDTAMPGSGNSTPSSGKKGRDRSCSISEAPSTPKKVRGRSSSFNDAPTPGKRKSKPQSSFGSSSDVDDLLLCRDHFFTGKCSKMAGRSKKTSACKLVHYHSHHLTLARVLQDGADTNLALQPPTVEMECSSKALSTIMSDGENEEAGTGIDMIYHMRINLPKPERDGNSRTDENSLSGLLSATLSSHECPAGSLVYVSLNGWLLFDRYRDGLLFSEASIHSVLSGGRRSRSASVVSEYDEDSDKSDLSDDPIVYLPGQLLECILAFLPDVAVATMSMVCQAWYKEIGKTSPDLWRHLLQRNDWPLPESVPVVHETERDRYRAAFLSHYGAMRDVRALQEGLSVLEGAAKKVGAKEMVVQAFASRQGAPQESNRCVGVQVWSANRVLAAYQNDCSLRLFETVVKPNSADSSVRGCRETVSVRAAPSSSSKRAPWRLVAMEMDEEVIGCLCENPRNGAVILTTIAREDYLCTAGGSTNDGTGYSEVEFLQVVNVGDAALNYLLSCDDLDHRLLHLHDFLMVEGGEVSDIDLLVTRTIVACGCGRFMLEVAISVPRLDEDHDGDPLMTLATRKLLLFSAEIDAVVWMGDTNPLDPMLHPREAHVSLVGHRCLTTVDRSCTASSVVVASGASTAMLSIEIAKFGEVEGVHFVQGSGLLPGQFARDGWEFVGGSARTVTMLPSDIVAADNLQRPVEETNVLRKGVISFYPRPGCLVSDCTEILVLDRCRILRINAIGEDHIAVFCVIPSDSSDMDVDGHWFGEPGHSRIDALHAVVVHVPSRKEIQRVRLAEVPIDGYEHVLVSSSGNTIAMCASWKGVILTGDDVRCVGESSDGHRSINKKKQKKKKKRRPSKGGKKDVFARGMSLRG